MTDYEYKKISHTVDMLEGEINRICVTHDKEEFVKMSLAAENNLYSLINAINEIQFFDVHFVKSIEIKGE